MIERFNNSQQSSIPTPRESLGINTEKAEAWIEAETDPEIKAIKRKIIENVDHVNFAEFQNNIQKLVEETVAELAGSHEKYALFFDYKPHSSKRWVYELSKMSYESHPPTESRHFTPSWEKMSQFKKLQKLADEGTNTFVISDDAVYSGEQILNRQINPILEFYAKTNRAEKPKFIILVPYVTSRFLKLIDEIKRAQNCDVFMHYSEIMPMLSEILTADEKEILRTKRGGKLNESDSEITYLDAALTYFDHRVADGHSFSEEVKRALDLETIKPYAETTNDYFIQEEKEFEAYKEEVFPKHTSV